MHDQKIVMTMYGGDQEIWTGPIISVDRVLVQVYSKGKMALNSKVMLHINILSIMLINLVINIDNLWRRTL